MITTPRLLKLTCLIGCSFWLRAAEDPRVTELRNSGAPPEAVAQFQAALAKDDTPISKVRPEDSAKLPAPIQQIGFPILSSAEIDADYRRFSKANPDQNKYSLIRNRLIEKGDSAAFFLDLHRMGEELGKLPIPSSPEAVEARAKFVAVITQAIESVKPTMDSPNIKVREDAQSLLRGPVHMYTGIDNPLSDALPSGSELSKSGFTIATRTLADINAVLEIAKRRHEFENFGAKTP